MGSIWRLKALYASLYIVTAVLCSNSQPAFAQSTTSTGSTDSLSTSLTTSTSVATETGTATSTLSGPATSDSETASATSSSTTAAEGVPTPSVIPAATRFFDPADPPAVDARVVPDFRLAWRAAYEKAKAKIATFTLEEKVNLTTGVGWENGRCVGNIPPIPYGTGESFPGLCLEDSPLGVRFADYVTAFPAGVNAAASFNRRLIRQRGLYMGREFKGKGVHIALGPMMNNHKIPQAGRNWEGFGADPFLAGEAAYETVLGIQQGGTQACAKHLINNEQERKRGSSSSLVDDRTQHEIYLNPFLRSVMAGAASIMCSYNQVNGTYACENNEVLNDLVKGELGFQGFIMSDWGAQHSTMSAVAGLDMTMPGGITFDGPESYWGPTLVQYVRNGTIPESRVDDMATRILAGFYLLHQDAPAFPPVSFDAFRPDDPFNKHIDVQQEEHAKLVRDLGAASIVLLKNEKHVLPLGKKDRSLVLVGSGAGPGIIGPNAYGDQGGSQGILAMGWGSGTANFTYLVSPLEAIQHKARQFRTSISWILEDFNLPRAGNMARFKSAALVFISADSGEEYITVDGNAGDRKNLTAWHGGDDLVLAVAAQNNNTIVIVNSVGQITVEPWIDHPNVTAVVWAGLPGQEAGNSLVDVLYGDWNPSGRLPYTIAKRIEDYSAQITTGGSGILDIPYTEALEVDYRAFDARNITPRFEFGFGLSYTSFDYSNFRIRRVTPDAEDVEFAASWESGQATARVNGSSTALWLHRPAYVVSFEVTNTGSVYGGDIPQLYATFPPSAGEPPSVLKGFTNVELGAGQTKTVSIPLSRYALSVWDTAQGGWKRPEGETKIVVGRSSRDPKIRGVVPA